MKFTLVLTFLLISLYAISAAPGPEPVPEPVPEPAAGPEPTPVFGLLGSLSNLLVALVKALSTLLTAVVG